MTLASKLVKLHPEARTELQDSVDFYGERSGQLKSNFKQRVVEGLREMAHDPGRYPKVPGVTDVRKCRLRQFPFSILYINRPHYVWVVAIAHGSRRPGYWKERLA